MQIEVSDYVLETIVHSIDEGERLKGLSNEDLVREVNRLNGEDDDLHIEEMCHRLWPEWLEAEW